MFLTLFKGKIHRATVTEANLNYMGSITIDGTLMRAAGILPGEKVQIVETTTAAAWKRMSSRVKPTAASSV